MLVILIDLDLIIMKKMTKLISLILSLIILISCKKENITVPVITTEPIILITQISATSGGNVTSEGGAPVVTRGICWSTNAEPTVADKTAISNGTSGSFSSEMTNLSVNTLYYVKAYATNKAGTGYGNQVTFTTSQIAVPLLTTSDITMVNHFNARTGGNITADYEGTVTERGVCWSRSHNPTIGDNRTIDTQTGIGTFQNDIYWIAPASTYYVRAYATNVAGTGYGNEVTITNPDNPVIFNPSITYGSVSDLDNNTYRTVTIGTQVWMAENLRTSKLNDGTSIPAITDNSSWSSLSTPGYCISMNDPGFKSYTGAIYNFYAVSTDKLCPAGWHVPTLTDLTILKDYLGVDGGSRIKETGTDYWTSPNTGATNLTGFTAIPAPVRLENGSFSEFTGVYTWWWLSSNYSSTTGAYFGMVNNRTEIENVFSLKKEAGVSVRCIKN
jgi:uncharacterized protein (TIGR02145 family)